jgi:hypothetical protein
MQHFNAAAAELDATIQCAILAKLSLALYPRVFDGPPRD